MIVDFSVLPALVGGAMIGTAAVLMMATIGQISGVSGIVKNAIALPTSKVWHWAFVAGLFSAGLTAHWLFGPMTLQIEASRLTLILSGVLVGLGTVIGRGCTSGHGVCGVSRLSPRSLTATGVFMLVAVLTVFFVRAITSEQAL